ncbi:LysM peptidoglycan-binding domain-containing protein [Glycomyces tenuis]|uniref:LysM peptidoglycan-binding domain-containing protein n=1 Tax=Glycomyces tenuis TaxID=58116 RepID=UPI00040F7415|nr:LysM peptidoglycan-binding domain-containing protein [Glycomyces tenuis]
MARIAEHRPTRADAHQKIGVDPAPAMRARLARAIALTVFSLVVMIGMPLFLYSVVGSRWPDRGPTLADFETLHLRSDTELLFGAIAVAGWGLWAVFTLMVLYAVVGAIVDVLRWGVAVETWRDASNPVRWLAGLLIGAIAALWPAAANAAPPEPVDQTVAERTLTDAELAHTTTASGEDQPAAADTEVQQSTHTIAPNESLYSLAEHYLGNGERWPEIWEANRGITMSNGQPFINPDFITDGTVITIPANQEPNPSGNEHTDTEIHIVQTGQHLYGLAEQYLGDGERWPEIWEANRDRAFADGRTFTDPDRIFAGWDLIIPLDTPATPPDNNEPDAEPEPEPELEGEGEISVPDDTPSAIEPTDPADPPPSDEPTAVTEEDTSPAPDHTETTDEPAAADSIPVGLWLSTGTFLAASTVVLLAARARRKRSSPKASRDEEGPVTGRLSDLEALIDREQQRLTEPAEVETEPMTLDLTEETGIPIGADRTTPINLTDLATPALGLTGPGHKGAARAAIIAALEAEHPVRITTEAADRFNIDQAADTDAFAIIDTLDDLTTTPHHQSPGSPLVVCTEADIDHIGADALAEQLALEPDRVIVLGPWPLGPTLTLAADGTVETDDHLAEIEQCYIADAALLDQVLHDHTQTEPAVPETTPEPSVNTENTARLEPEPLQNDKPELESTHQAEATEPSTAATRFRLCVFGDLELYYNGVPVKLKQRARALTLLAALACADQPRAMTELLDIVVPDRPLTGARKYLNTIKANTRSAVRELAGDDTLDPIPYDPKTETFSLDTNLVTTDLAEFDDAEQTAALATDPADQAAALERLVALHTGDLTSDLEDLDDLRENYRIATKRACRTLASHYAEIGDSARAAKYRDMSIRDYADNGVTGPERIYGDRREQ